MRKIEEPDPLSVHWTLSETEARIILAAMSNFFRFGIKKTTMADIAKDAEVSRQTLYASFGTKTDMVVASTLYLTRTQLKAAQEALADCKSLDEQLEAYFTHTVRKISALLKNASDRAELLHGHNRIAKNAVIQAHNWHRHFVCALLNPYETEIRKTNQTPAGLAHFLVSVMTSLKYEVEDEEDLETLLFSLKKSILLTTGQVTTGQE